ncbi:MAG: hypothetical protein HZB87_14250, partial [Desulfatitalea sp.]|nr:hypothetical protein [Desulfatitalea sp.]
AKKISGRSWLMVAGAVIASTSPSAVSWLYFANRLLELEIDLGEPEPPTLVAGIAESYSPDELIGRQIIVVANLKPAKLMGVLSKGMLLAASSDSSDGSEKQTVALTVDRPMPPGSPIK